MVYFEAVLNNQPDNALSSQISRVRQLSRASLTRFSSQDNSGAYETVLIHQGNLWGLRFTLGNFHARWQIDTDEIQLLRDSQLLQRLPLEPSTIRRAA